MPEKKEIKIFIIEDDFVFIEILTNLIDTISEELHNELVSLNYQTFYSAKEAGFELSCNPDIVLLDYFIMDDELNADTGTKLLKDIKEHDSTIDVLVISGQESQAVKEELLKKGATSYISKDEESLIQLKPLLKNIILKHLNN
jgi:two-component system, NtrC family, response regulator AtoC